MKRIRHHAPVLLALALLCGCSSLLGGPKEPTTIYAPVLEVQPDPAWPAVSWSLEIARPTGAPVLDGLHIMVSPTPGELQAYRAARWAQTPGAMIETGLMRTLEDSGKIAAVSAQGSGAAAGYRLLLDLRDFRSDYAGSATPSATIEVNAKLLHLADRTIVGSRTFKIAQPAAGVDVAQVSDAFARAIGSLSHDLAGWALETGQAHQRQHHP